MTAEEQIKQAENLAQEHGDGTVTPIFTHASSRAALGLSDERVLAVAAALESARVFIRNGVELGYIRMPDTDCPDPAHGTLPLIERAMHMLSRAPAATVAEPSGANLEGLAKALLAPREIVRDAQGWLDHPALPVCDENVRFDELLGAFGLETYFRAMDGDIDCDAYERIVDAGNGCAEWTPTPPEGEGWTLLTVYETEDGPYAMFARQKQPEPRKRYRKSAQQQAEPSDAESALARLRYKACRNAEKLEVNAADLRALIGHVDALHAQAYMAAQQHPAPVVKDSLTAWQGVAVGDEAIERAAIAMHALRRDLANGVGDRSFDMEFDDLHDEIKKWTEALLGPLSLPPSPASGRAWPLMTC